MGSPIIIATEVPKVVFHTGSLGHAGARCRALGHWLPIGVGAVQPPRT